jgi:ABC-type transporter Mla subunit MlaD
LREVASSLTAAVEQMGGAARGFAAAQASTAKLSQDMAAAAQRFEGVDRALAGTLSGLGAALDDFTRRVQEFAGNTDRHLATAAQHVSTMVTELTDTLEAFGLNRRAVLHS